VDIDAEIEVHREAICSLQRRRNSRIAINTLPIEILGRIFLHHICPALQRILPGSEYDHKLFQGAIAFSQVCSHWRSVALSTPNLWTTLRYFEENWIAELLDRSKDAPLMVYMPDSLPANVTTSILNRLPRICELRLDVDESLSALTVTYLRHYSAPLVEAATFCARAHNKYDLILPDDLFARNAPRLRSLILNNISLHWDMPILANLTELEVLLSVSSNGPHIPAIHEVLGGLAHMPYLRSLHLSSFSSQVSSLHLEGILACLPLLKDLSITGKFTPVCALLRRLEWSSLSQIHVKMLLDDDGDDLKYEHDDTFPRLASRLCHPRNFDTDKLLRTVAIEDRFNMVYFNAYTILIDDIENGPAYLEQATLSISVETSGIITRQSNLVKVILHSLSEHPVEALRISGVDLIDTTEWVDHLVGTDEPRYITFRIYINN
jgi:hypothetical protein